MNLSSHQLGPKGLPCLLAQNLPRQLPARRLFRADCDGGAHLSTPAKALIEVGLIDAREFCEASSVFGAVVHAPDCSGTLHGEQAFRYRLYNCAVLQTDSMETASERRKRKLTAMCDSHGSKAVASKAGLNPFTLEQIMKGVLLEAKADGTRSVRSLGDRAARTIEKAYDLPEGWFDADDERMQDPFKLSENAMAVAFSFDKLNEREQRRFLSMLDLARDEPPPYRGDMTNIGELDGMKTRQK